MSDFRRKQLQSTGKHLRRFESQTRNILSFENITPSFLSDFEEFLLNNNEDNEIYASIDKNKRPRKKSQNTVSHILKRF